MLQKLLQTFFEVFRLVILVDLDMDLVVEEEIEVKATGTWDLPGLQEFNFIVPTGKTGLIIGKGAKAGTNPNSAAWAAYYAHYYQRQAQPPPAAPAGAPTTTQTKGQGDQQNPASAGQVDYTKTWEEYYKKMGQAVPAPTGADYSVAWDEYYRQQAAYYGQASPQGMPQHPPAPQDQ
ncbi:Far upstream element-binding protein 1 [Sciurus carolinensis]|uniref:Far upstream element-binding protein 1 n=1 Tax=Sciurus carolinensis TaxID=30640 RepID=A0AA41MGH7_SCICA|nr:Far upstream element-binding protein 1 [Sciurus carolinensis]